MITITFTIESCGKTVKTQIGPWNCFSEKVLYLLMCKVCSKASYSKAKRGRDIDLIMIKVNKDHSKKEIDEIPKKFYTTIIAPRVTQTLMIGILFCINNARHINSWNRERNILAATTTAQKWSFPLKISSVNVTKSAGDCGFGYIYWRNLSWKFLFFV